MGRYRILSKLAVGGMAEVFLAKSIGAGGFEKPVALKRMLPSLAADPGSVESFIREARLTVALQHPNVVQVMDLGIYQTRYHLVMEFVEGDNLRNLINALASRGERVGYAEACWIVSQVARGLEHAHTRTDGQGKPLNIIHRDINPANVMVSSSGEVKLADFGIAKAQDGGQGTQAGMIKGKASYLSPEQVLGAELDQRSDLFLMGLMLHELLSGKRLFEAPNYFQALRMIEAFDPSTLQPIPGVPEELMPIIGVCLAREPAARIGSAGDLATALESYLFENRKRVGPADIAALFARTLPGWRSPLQAPPPAFAVEISLDALDASSATPPAKTRAPTGTTPAIPPRPASTMPPSQPTPPGSARPGSVSTAAVSPTRPTSIPPPSTQVSTAGRMPAASSGRPPSSTTLAAITPGARPPSLGTPFAVPTGSPPPPSQPPATPPPAPSPPAPASEGTTITDARGRRWRRIGEILISQGKLTEAQVQNALARQKRKGGRMTDFLTSDGVISSSDVIRALSEQTGTPFISDEKLREMPIPEVANLLPQERATQLKAVPVAQRGEVLYCAMVEPLDNEQLKTLRLLTKVREVKGLYATEAGIKSAIGRFYRPEDEGEHEWKGQLIQYESMGLTPFADKVTKARERFFDANDLDAGNAPAASANAPPDPAELATLPTALRAEQAGLEVLLRLLGGPEAALADAMGLARRVARRLGGSRLEQARAGAHLLTLAGAARAEGRPPLARPSQSALRALVGTDAVELNTLLVLGAVEPSPAVPAGPGATAAAIVQAYTELAGAAVVPAAAVGPALEGVRADPRWAGSPGMDALAAALQEGRGEAVSATVVVASADPRQAATLQARLQGAGFRVILAGTGAQARAQLEQGAQVLIAETALPDGTGLSLVHALRQAPATSQARLFLVAAPEEAEAATAGIDAGADDVFVRPFNAELVVAKVRRAVTGR